MVSCMRLNSACTSGATGGTFFLHGERINRCPSSVCKIEISARVEVDHGSWAVAVSHWAQAGARHCAREQEPPPGSPRSRVPSSSRKTGSLATNDRRLQREAPPNERALDGQQTLGKSFPSDVALRSSWVLRASPFAWTLLLGPSEQRQAISGDLQPPGIGNVWLGEIEVTDHDVRDSASCLRGIRAITVSNAHPIIHNTQPGGHGNREKGHRQKRAVKGEDNTKQLWRDPCDATCGARGQGETSSKSTLGAYERLAGISQRVAASCCQPRLLPGSNSSGWRGSGLAPFRMAIYDGGLHPRTQRPSCIVGCSQTRCVVMVHQLTDQRLCHCRMVSVNRRNAIGQLARYAENRTRSALRRPRPPNTSGSRDVPHRVWLHRVKLPNAVRRRGLERIRLYCWGPPASNWHELTRSAKQKPSTLQILDAWDPLQQDAVLMHN